MTTRCPAILPLLVIADDARLAAQLSCLFASPGAYLPVIDGPKLNESDLAEEISRRNDAAARAKPSVILLAGLSDASCEAITRHFTPRLKAKLERVKTLSDVDSHRQDLLPLKRPPLQWGRDRVGVGLLKALRIRSGIVFSDDSSPAENVPPKSDHVVVCEEGDELSQVIAANYAFALSAGLHIIPDLDGPTSEQILEDFYGRDDRQPTSRAEALKNLTACLRERCGPVPITPSGSVTFVTRRLPYGFAFPEFPSTHLFSPGIGIAVINGFAAEQPNTHGVSVAALVDPSNTTAREIDAAKTLLSSSNLFLRSHEGSGASVRAVTEMIELFPYDLLIFATHCGDASGFRQTYEFTDSEGLERKLVADVALGFARTGQKDTLHARRFIRVVSLDGVDWRDPKAAEKLYVGRAILDFIARTTDGSQNPLAPIKSESIPRIVGSTVLKMYDQNYMSLPRPIADHGTPIVINNACGSWHQLAENYMAGDARAYIGTLRPVTANEAQEVVVKLLGKHFEQPLPAALWMAQREVYGDNITRPYVMTGVYPQRLRTSHHDIPKYIASRLTRALGRWKGAVKMLDSRDAKTLKTYQEIIQFYKDEIAAIKRRWLNPASGLSKKI